MFSQDDRCAEGKKSWVEVVDGKNLGVVRFLRLSSPGTAGYVTELGLGVQS